MRACLLLFAAFALLASAKHVTPVTTGCDTPACEFIQGLLSGLGFSVDIDKCLKDVDVVMKLATAAATEFNNKQYNKAMIDFATALDMTGAALSDCELQAVAQVVEDLAKDLGIANITVIGNVVHIIIDGEDVYDDFFQIAKSLATKDYSTFGRAISDLIVRLQAAQCDTPACTIITGLLKTMQLVIPHMKICANDLDAAWSEFGDFVYDINQHHAKDAVAMLSKALYTLSNAVDDCGLPDLGRLVADEAKKLGLADVVVVSDTVVEVLVDGTDLYDAIYLAYQDIVAKRYADFGVQLAKLVTELSGLGCTSESCQIVTGILKMLEIIVPDMQKCEGDMTKSIATIEAAFGDFKNKNYNKSITELATGLNVLGKGVSDCGLVDLSNLIVAEAKALGLGNVTVISNVVHIIVNGVDVYDDFYQAFMDFQSKNWVAFGRDLAVLLSRIEMTHCSTPACEAVEAILKLLRIVMPDLHGCEADLTAAWSDLELAASYFGAKNYKASVAAAAAGLSKMGASVKACGLPEVGALIEEYAAKLGLGNVSIIGQTIQILVDGVDMYQDFYTFCNAISTKNYHAAATSLAALVSELRLIGCRTPACNVIEGIVEVMELVLDHLTTCETDLDGAWKFMGYAMTDFRAKKYSEAMMDLADAFNELAQGVEACGVPELSVALDNIMKLLHFHTVSLEAAVKIIVAGVDVWDDIYAVVEDYEHGQYRQLGRDLGQLIEKLYQISGKKCDGDKACLVFEGVLEALLVVPDWKVCKADVEDGWKDLEGMCTQFEKKNYKTALHDLAEGGHEFSLAVADCDIQQLADIIETLAKKLGFGSIWWLEEIVKIVVEGADIYDDVFGIYTDVERKNYFGLGLDLAKLIKLLV